MSHNIQKQTRTVLTSAVIQALVKQTYNMCLIIHKSTHHQSKCLLYYCINSSIDTTLGSFSQKRFFFLENLLFILNREK